MLSHLIFECKNNTIVVIQRIFLMKRSFLFFLLLSLLVSNKTTAIDIPINTPPPPHPIVYSTSVPSKSLTLQMIVTNSELAINFESSTGMSILSLTDESGRLVYQETVTVTTGLIYYLPIDMLENGNYILTVTTDNGSLFGIFPVEIN